MAAKKKPVNYAPRRKGNQAPRNAPVQTRVTEYERKLISAAANKVGMSREDWARRVLLTAAGHANLVQGADAFTEQVERLNNVAATG